MGSSPDATTTFALTLTDIDDSPGPTFDIVSSDANGQIGNDASFGASVSADGRYIAFASRADNFDPYDTNGQTDVFVKDTLTGTVTLVSTASNGSQGDRHKPGTIHLGGWALCCIHERC